MLLDLTATFNTVDHDILIFCLNFVGIKGNALECLGAVCERFPVSHGELRSSSASLPCGVKVKVLAAGFIIDLLSEAI